VDGRVYVSTLAPVHRFEEIPGGWAGMMFSGFFQQDGLQ
jgi:hypothetical protein